MRRCWIRRSNNGLSGGQVLEISCSVASTFRTRKDGMKSKGAAVLRNLVAFWSGQSLGRVLLVGLGRLWQPNSPEWLSPRGRPPPAKEQGSILSGRVPPCVTNLLYCIHPQARFAPVSQQVNDTSLGNPSFVPQENISGQRRKNACPVWGKDAFAIENAVQTLAPTNRIQAPPSCSTSRLSNFLVCNGAAWGRMGATR